MDAIYADYSISMSEFKRNPAQVLRSAGEKPVAVLNHNRPEAYLISAAHYERLMAYLEDLEDIARVRERSTGPFVEVSLDEL